MRLLAALLGLSVIGLLAWKLHRDAKEWRDFDDTDWLHVRDCYTDRLAA